ncbi:MAG: alpha/beta hydrolase, partial [Clostridiales Family XIII bacterium]|nr:alpha/beta hydrolase [Clostridiales Family XIII bacterium]
AADVRELIEHLALDNVVLAGFSLGAFIVLEYVRVYGCGGIAKVVLADITPKFINEDGWDLGLYQGEYTRSQFDAHMRGGIEDFNRQTAYFIYRNLLRADPGRRFRRTAPAWARVLTFLIFGNSRERMAVVYFYFKSTCERDHRDTLSMIAADTAIFYADPGSLFPPGAAKYMAEKIPNGARLVPFHGSPHTRVLRPASRFVRELLSFIGGDVI